MHNSKTGKKLTGGIIAIILLTVCLAITTFALVFASVSVDNNIFKTGEVKINLNDGKPVIKRTRVHFSSRMTVKRISSSRTTVHDVYYKIYLSDVSGGLSSVLDITVSDGDKVLYSGTAESLFARA